MAKAKRPAPEDDEDDAPASRPSKTSSTTKASSATRGDPDADSVVQYLKRQNRPYSANDVFQNLHGAIPKAKVVKLLNDLVEANAIRGKCYGKQWVYVATQEDRPKPSRTEVQATDLQIAQLKEETAALRGDVARLTEAVSKYRSIPTLEALEARRAALQAQADELRTRLAPLEAGQSHVSEKEIKAIRDRRTAALRQWRLRKKLFKDMWDTITENMPTKPKDLMEDLGIETDEAVGAVMPKA
ncbi:hypothetical protein CXG81DRAFT_14400 [Caulochytrium protostelioides]|uniref:Homologous-pairing protein 2 homolog n=1 Tax=Caulochytrium protostelioides TaxID=1555241 RepID=A0A4P9X3B6_9FUNG|nr:hypothetical protein CXG81DRAFT_14400 [Caulochytrium protostelioides]|eukprot:RKO99515.1 hypothetical protein CXG81DRAFT_14400 [Caulochytrium protostelioides]